MANFYCCSMLYNYFMLSCTELTLSLRQVSPGCVHQLIICITQSAFAHSLNIQPEVGWCKRHAPYLNSSEAAQGSLLTYPHSCRPAQKLLTLDIQGKLSLNTKAALLEHTTLGCIEVYFLSCKLYKNKDISFEQQILFVHHILRNKNIRRARTSITYKL